MFGVIILAAEFVPGGGVVANFRYQGLNLLRYNGGGGGMVLASEIIFVIFVCFFTRREYRCMKKDWREYFADKWNYMEIIVISLSFIAIIFYLIKTAYTYWILDMILASKGRKYIRMESLAVFDKATSEIVACILFFATIKLLRLLRFNRRVGYLTATLKFAGPAIIAFFIIISVTMVAFTSLFYLNTRTSSESFSTMLRTLETLFFIMNDKFKDLTADSRLIGPLAFFVFTFIMNFIVFTFLIAIICEAFTHIKRDLGSQPNDYEVVNYMIAVAGGVYRRYSRRVYVGKEEKDDNVENLKYIDNKLNIIMSNIKRNAKAYQSPLW